MRKKIALLGATGSIGLQTLEILRIYPEEFELAALAVRGNNPLKLLEILREFQPANVFLAHLEAHPYFQEEFPDINFVSAESDLQKICRDPEIEIVLNAFPGAQGLAASRTAVDAGKTLLLANKESLVIAGEELLEKAAETGSRVIPIDSEISAIFQILKAHSGKISRVFLPCSGGPFLSAPDWPKRRLAAVKIDEAVRHPLWSMGPKISIDSATLMNKAFELIALSVLFQVPEKRIEVLVHPQCIVHGAVEFQNGATWIQRGTPDMKPCIAAALFFDREEHQLPIERCDNFQELFHFEKVDEDRFKALKLAKIALQKGPELRTRFCRENDFLVEKFLAGKIGFLEIEDHLWNLFGQASLPDRDLSEEVRYAHHSD